MSKKKKIIIILGVIFAILLSFIGGKTFSKYRTEVKGQGAANIASWYFNVNGGDKDMEIISLNSTFDDKYITSNQLAPGAKGSFNIVIDTTTSEVGVDYKVEFEEIETKPTNLIFRYENQEYKTLQELQNDLTGTIDANDNEKTRTLTIDWEWPYETGEDPETIAQNDKIDTEEGKELWHYAFDVTVTGTQVVPQ